MDAPYEELRKQAAAKRDKIIESAKQEYRVTMRRIRALHFMVTGTAHPSIRPPRRAKDRTLTEVLLMVLPKAKSFTVAEACDIVYQDPLACKYKETSIRAQLNTMARNGHLRKVGRRAGHILWVRSDSEIQPGPFGTLTFCEIAEQFIQERGPLRIAEIVALMREQGYRPDEAPHFTYNMLRRSMTRISGRFVKDQAGRWSAAQNSPLKMVAEIDIMGE